MKTAGLVLDFYDDRGGETLKSICPTPESLPECVKVAHMLSPEERSALRDEAFALILHSDDGHLRKFACVDEGNTALSTIYFLENAEKLPAEAIKTAAQNLIAFNQDFGLDVPSDLVLAAETGMPVKEKTAIIGPLVDVANLGIPSGLGYLMGKDEGRKMRDRGEKLDEPSIALGAVVPGYVGYRFGKKHGHEEGKKGKKKHSAAGMGRKRNTETQPYVGDEADWAQRTNLISVRGGADSGRVIPTANQMKTAGVKLKTLVDASNIAGNAGGSQRWDKLNYLNARGWAKRRGAAAAKEMASGGTGSLAVRQGQSLRNLADKSLDKLKAAAAMSEMKKIVSRFEPGRPLAYAAGKTQSKLFGQRAGKAIAEAKAAVRSGKSWKEIGKAASISKLAYTLADMHLGSSVIGGGLGAVKGAVAPGKDEKGRTKSRIKGALKSGAKGVVLGNLAAAGGVLAHGAVNGNGRGPMHGGMQGLKDAAGAYREVAGDAYNKAKSVFKKTSAAGQSVASVEQKEKLYQTARNAAANFAKSNKKPGAKVVFPQAGLLSPLSTTWKHVQAHVDVSRLEPKYIERVKVASRTALNGNYSLDSYSDVTDAITYFSECWPEMDPSDRHEFCVKTASRADELGIAVPELMDRYGSTEYAPDVEAHLANRRRVDPAHSIVWDDLQEKRAMIEPETFAELLKEADTLFNLDAEWGGAVADPYYATFGGRGQEKLAWASETQDGTSITEQDLRSIPQEKIQENFAPDFAEAFAADPTTIFDSMPADTKQVLARMARGA